MTADQSTPPAQGHVEPSREDEQDHGSVGCAIASPSRALIDDSLSDRPLSERAWIVWNEAKNEGVVFVGVEGYGDAVQCALGVFDGISSSLGEAFAEMYDDDERTIEEIDLAAPLQSPSGTPPVQSDGEGGARSAEPTEPKTSNVGAVGAGWKRGFYVASRASLPARGVMWRAYRAAGIPITSSWIDEDGPKASRDLCGLWVRILAEIQRSEALVLYVEPDDFPLKGALIEVGAALAASVPVVIVAPGVELEPRNCRPLGSWIKHPLVSFAQTVEEAFTRFPSDAAPAQPSALPEGDEMTGRVSAEKLQAIIEKHEQGENHDEGAFDADCGICRLLEDLRAILSPSPAKEV